MVEAPVASPASSRSEATGQARERKVWGLGRARGKLPAPPASDGSSRQRTWGCFFPKLGWRPEEACAKRKPRVNRVIITYSERLSE